MKQSHKKGSPRFARDARSPLDAARLTFKEINTEISMLAIRAKKTPLPLI